MDAPGVGAPSTRKIPECFDVAEKEAAQQCRPLLFFATDKLAAQLDGPGAYLRMCGKGIEKGGPIVKVADPEDAIKKSRKFCVCYKKRGKARDCAPGGARFSGLLSPRRRRKNRKRRR